MAPRTAHSFSPNRRQKANPRPIQLRSAGPLEMKMICMIPLHAPEVLFLTKRQKNKGELVAELERAGLSYITTAICSSTLRVVKSPAQHRPTLLTMVVSASAPGQHKQYKLNRHREEEKSTPTMGIGYSTVLAQSRSPSDDLLAWQYRVRTLSGNDPQYDGWTGVRGLRVCW